MHKHLMKMGEVTFDKIFNQKLGKCRGKFILVDFIRVYLVFVLLPFLAVILLWGEKNDLESPRSPTDHKTTTHLLDLGPV